MTSTPINREKVEAARTQIEEAINDAWEEHQDWLAENPDEQDPGPDGPVIGFYALRTLLADHAAQAEDIERQSEALNRATDESDAKDREIKALGLAITAQAETIKSLTEALMSLSSAMADMLHADVNPNLVTIRRHRLSGWVQRADTALSKALPNTGEQSQ